MRPTITLFIWLFCLPSVAFPQQEREIDSLQTALQQAASPQDKFAAHIGLWDAYINTDIDAALHQAEQIIRLGETLPSANMLYSGYLKKGISYAYMNAFDSSGVYFRRALAYYQQTDDLEVVASIQRNLGQDHNIQGELDSAAHYYGLAGANFARLADSVGVADIYNSEAVLYLMQGYYNMAFDKAVSAEGIFMRSPDLAGDLNQNRLVIAAIYGSMHDTLHAIEYYRKTTAYFKEQGMVRQYASNGMLLLDLLVPKYQQYPEVESIIREMGSISADLKDMTLIYRAKAKEAEWYANQGDHAAAIAILRPLADESVDVGNELEHASIILALGRTLQAADMGEQAIPYLREADALFADFGMELEQSTANQLLAFAQEQSGNFEQSLAHYKAYTELDKKIFSEERTQRFDELQTIYETEKKEHAIALQEQTIAALNADAKANRITRIVYGIGMISFLLISVLTATIYRQKIKKAAFEREQQEAQYQQEINFKKKELASQTLHLVQKNTFIQELKEKLDVIKGSPDLFKVEFNRIVSLLHRQSAEDENWEVFKSYFSEVHNDFDVNLKSIAPDITENDIRLASFLRMNLTIKEIASMLHVQPESVMKSKYRLKKKLGLVKEDDLDEYLRSL